MPSIMLRATWANHSLIALLHSGVVPIPTCWTSLEITPKGVQEFYSLWILRS